MFTPTRVNALMHAVMQLMLLKLQCAPFHPASCHSARLSCPVKVKCWKKKKNLITFPTMRPTVCRWGTWRYRLAIRKWVFSPLPSLPMLWESCPVTLIRNALDRHESQHMLNEERGNAALLCILTAPTSSVSTCYPEFSYLCVSFLFVHRWRNVTNQARCHLRFYILVPIWYLNFVPIPKCKISQVSIKELKFWYGSGTIWSKTE